MFLVNSNKLTSTITYGSAGVALLKMVKKAVYFLGVIPLHLYLLSAVPTGFLYVCL